MNKVVLMGRLTADPDVKTVQGNDPLKIARYTLAVDRRGDKTDFPVCKCFGKTAEFAEKYLQKGTKILVEGQIQTGKYERNGETVYTTDVIVDHHEFCERKRQDEFQDEYPEDLFE
ncbi:MAG: single-stranded DNA-binding protein [Clostridiales bacterium]|nr:single-stranded DNA-binding protein [Clostridiales bacterium]